MIMVVKKRGIAIFRMFIVVRFINTSVSFLQFYQIIKKPYFLTLDNQMLVQMCRQKNQVFNYLIITHLQKVTEVVFIKCRNKE